MHGFWSTPSNYDDTRAGSRSFPLTKGHEKSKIERLSAALLHLTALWIASCSNPSCQLPSPLPQRRSSSRRSMLLKSQSPILGRCMAWSGQDTLHACYASGADHGARGVGCVQLWSASTSFYHTLHLGRRLRRDSSLASLHLRSTCPSGDSRLVLRLTLR